MQFHAMVYASGDMACCCGCCGLPAPSGSMSHRRLGLKSRTLCSGAGMRDEHGPGPRRERERHTAHKGVTEDYEDKGRPGARWGGRGRAHKRVGVSQERGHRQRPPVRCNPLRPPPPAACHVLRVYAHECMQSVQSMRQTLHGALAVLTLRLARRWAG